MHVCHLDKCHLVSDRCKTYLTFYESHNYSEIKGWKLELNEPAHRPATATHWLRSLTFRTNVLFFVSQGESLPAHLHALSRTKKNHLYHRHFMKGQKTKTLKNRRKKPWGTLGSLGPMGVVFIRPTLCARPTSEFIECRSLRRAKQTELEFQRLDLVEHKKSTLITKCHIPRGSPFQPRNCFLL